MHIDFTLQIDEVKVNLSMNCKQCINDIIEDIFNIEREFFPDYYFSCMQERMMSGYKILEEENIKNGDRLIAVRGRNVRG